MSADRDRERGLRTCEWYLDEAATRAYRADIAAADERAAARAAAEEEKEDAISTTDTAAADAEIATTDTAAADAEIATTDTAAADAEIATTDTAMPGGGSTLMPCAPPAATFASHKGDVWYACPSCNDLSGWWGSQAMCRMCGHARFGKLTSIKE
jgi:hypothetical protein